MRLLLLSCGGACFPSPKLLLSSPTLFLSFINVEYSAVDTHILFTNIDITFSCKKKKNKTIEKHEAYTIVLAKKERYGRLFWHIKLILLRCFVNIGNIFVCFSDRFPVTNGIMLFSSMNAMDITTLADSTPVIFWCRPLLNHIVAII